MTHVKLTCLGCQNLVCLHTLRAWRTYSAQPCYARQYRRFASAEICYNNMVYYCAQKLEEGLSTKLGTAKRTLSLSRKACISLDVMLLLFGGLKMKMKSWNVYVPH